MTSLGMTDASGAEGEASRRVCELRSQISRSVILSAKREESRGYGIAPKRPLDSSVADSLRMTRSP
jgi:hypothetical protein